MRLFAGDDWAEDHHDVELMDERGRVLARGRLPEGVAGLARLHELTGEQLGEGADDAEVIIGTGTGRGPWVGALVAAGYTVYGVNPLQAPGYRERHGVSGARSDRGDAHMLTDMVRTDSRQLRAVAGDSPGAGAVKVVARTRKTLIWERNRQVQRLRHQLREYFPAALDAFAGLDAPDALELPGKAPDPAKAAKLTRAQVSAALKRARRRDIPGKATVILAALRSVQLGQPPAVTAACAVTARSLIAVITVLNEQVKALQGQVEADFGRHPDAEIYLSQPGLGYVLGARGPRRVRRRPGSVCQRQGPQELRRHLPAHPRLGQEEDGHGPVHPQRPAHRRADGPGPVRPGSFAWRPGPLRRRARPRHRAQRCPAQARQPARRHPPRLPQDPHPLRRGNRLAAPGKDPSI